MRRKWLLQRRESLFGVAVGPYAIWTSARDARSLGGSKLGWLEAANKTHKCVHNHRHTHTHTCVYACTLQVWLKNMITNTVEPITFLAVYYMSTHAEHPCPPPFIVLLFLIINGGEMIMISLTAKYECKFTSLVPDKTHGMYENVIIFCGQTGKEHF